MSKELTTEDIELILESLRYTKKRIDAYTDYPTEEFKIQRIEEVEKVIEKVKLIKSET